MSQSGFSALRHCKVIKLLDTCHLFSSFGDDRISFYSEGFYSAYNSKLCNNLYHFVNAATVMVKLVKGRRAVRRAFGSDTSSSISPGKRLFCYFFSIVSVRSSQCLCCRGVKQPWHETTDFPLLGKDQKPNVSQTLLLLPLKRYKLGELLHRPSENFLESWAFFCEIWRKLMQRNLRRRIRDIVGEI